MITNLIEKSRKGSIPEEKIIDRMENGGVIPILFLAKSNADYGFKHRSTKLKYRIIDYIFDNEERLEKLKKKSLEEMTNSVGVLLAVEENKKMDENNKEIKTYEKEISSGKKTSRILNGPQTIASAAFIGIFEFFEGESTRTEYVKKMKAEKFTYENTEFRVVMPFNFKEIQKITKETQSRIWEKIPNKRKLNYKIGFFNKGISGDLSKELNYKKGLISEWHVLRNYINNKIPEEIESKYNCKIRKFVKRVKNEKEFELYKIQVSNKLNLLKKYKKELEKENRYKNGSFSYEELCV